MRKPITKIITVAIVALMAQLVVPVFSGTVQAAGQFHRAIVRLDRHKISTATGGTVCVNPETDIVAGASTVFDVQVDFPSTTGALSDYTVNTTAANWVTDTTFTNGAEAPTAPSIDMGDARGIMQMTAWPFISAAASSVSGQTVTWTFSDAGGITLAATSLYCFHFGGTNTLTAPGAPADSLDGVVRVRDDSAVTLQETNWATSVIGDDQVVVSAIVPPNFKFSISGNLDDFGRLVTNAINSSTGGISFRVETNAKDGWIAWVKDSQQGLYSATAGYTIPTIGTVDGTPSDLVTAGGAEGYLLKASIKTAAGGSHSCLIGNNATEHTDPEYNASDVVTGLNTQSGGTLSSIFQPVAQCSGAAPATSNGDEIYLTERATIEGGTPAGTDYTDTITVVAAGSF